MAKLFAIGEALIDFIPQTKGVQLKEVQAFEPQIGGAPTNVASCVATLGKASVILTQLGKDAFGDLIEETLSNIGVDTSFVQRTSDANTGLAFVSLTHEGERDFAFYRKPSADMLMETIDVTFNSDDILHFCSVDLIDAPIKNAHIKAIEDMHKADGLVVFDPNLRFPLWPSKSDLKDTVLEFMPKAHIVKISDEELEFLSGSNEVTSLQQFFKGYTEIIIYTQGEKGASIYTKQGLFAQHNGFKVDVKDTTGAGDAFIGAFLYKILGHEPITYIENHAIELLEFSNAVGALTTTKNGAIRSLPNLNDIEMFRRGLNVK